LRAFSIILCAISTAFTRFISIIFAYEQQIKIQLFRLLLVIRVFSLSRAVALFSLIAAPLLF
jgi:hypothetical protein